ncbi:hypothetical protein PQQ73_10995 [Paraburkholderia strydomiana]|jgi:hypothetical protein|uniref:Glycosyltransferase RgtA/B/C/D-like domain-containing protein n=1 Tax=Paraburkholderia strydomiana TaxID=1245417 RepID=A0ABW9EF66_9BURK
MLLSDRAKILNQGASRTSFKWLMLFGFCVCAVLGGLVSVHMGADFNWDLQNYHLYNPYAFLTGRVGHDFMAAGIQSYLNPLLDVPMYLSSTTLFHDRPCFTAFLMGIPYGVAIFLCFGIARAILGGVGPTGTVEVIAAVAIGVTGTVTVSEIGTSFNDIPIALLVLGAVWIELRNVGDRKVSGLYAGLLLGLAAGLKMTAVIFAPGFVLGIMMARRNWRLAFLSACLFSAAWCVGYAVAGGWWAWRIYSLYGNPIFPMFNGAFHSPWFSSVGRDLRFMPHNAASAVFYPFVWMQGKSFVSEVPMRDARFAVTYVAIVVSVLLSIWATRRRHHEGVQVSLVQRGRLTLLVTFFVITFAIWELLFSIARYMVALELLTGILIVIAIRAVCQRVRSGKAAGGASAAIAAIIAAALILTGLPMDWGRMHYTAVPALVDTRIDLPDGATVLTIGPPVAFMLPFIRSRDSHFIGVEGATVMMPPSSPVTQMIRARLTHSSRNNWVLTNRPLKEVNDLTQPYGLRAHEEGCRDLPQSPQRHVRICPLHFE